ncbi:hypothetical protein XHV734_2363 [Xanthomonas hortorum pv. vitians]|nr:hypothetical protein XHV734_2363 [Xanthomonas hortorum pv. vitians]
MDNGPEFVALARRPPTLSSGLV